MDWQYDLRSLGDEISLVEPSSDDESSEGVTTPPSSRSSSPETSGSIFIYIGRGENEENFEADMDVVRESTFLAKRIRDRDPAFITLRRHDADEIRRLLSWLHRESIDIDQTIPEYESSSRDCWVEDYILANKFGVETWCNAILDEYIEDLSMSKRISRHTGMEIMELKKVGLKKSPLSKLLMKNLAWRLYTGSEKEHRRFAAEEGNRVLLENTKAVEKILKYIKKAKDGGPMDFSDVCKWHVHETTPGCYWD